jgi:hypothetical protein
MALLYSVWEKIHHDYDELLLFFGGESGWLPLLPLDDFLMEFTQDF